MSTRTVSPEEWSRALAGDLIEIAQSNAAGRDRDTRGLVTEDHDRPAVGSGEVGQANRLVGQFHSGDARTLGPLALEPANRIPDHVEKGMTLPEDPRRPWPAATRHVPAGQPRPAVAH